MTAQELGPEWNISPEGLNILIAKKGNGNVDLSKLALDHDLKDIGNPILSQEIPKNRLTKVVLQIQKVRNVAAPKAKENSQAAPRMLKITLTDGTTYIQAVETSTIPAINRDKTPPGAKLLINNARIVSGFLLLDKGNCSLLGGKVAHLYEKWEVSKSVQNHNRLATSSEGAPPWVNFGVKITSSDNPQFKSLESKNKDPSKEATEFDQQRKDAIAEANTGAVRKVFGGGAKQVTLTTTTTITAANYGTKQPGSSDYREKRAFKSKMNPKLDAENDSYVKLEKPSERVLLSDFFDDILPSKDVTTTNEAPAPKQTYNYNNKPQFNKGSGYGSSYNTNERNKYGNSYQSNHQYHSNQYGSSHNQFNHPGHENRSGFGNQPPDHYKPKQTYNSSETKRPRENYPGNNTTTITRPVNPEPEQNRNQNPVENISNRLSRVSLNNQFASRTLKQQLNIGGTGGNRSNNNNPDGKSSWKIGDDCLAKYWEDGKMYDATVTAVTDKTCVVRFAGYGNIEEVLKSDCVPGRGGGYKSGGGPGNQNARPYSGFQDTHRNTRTYSRRQ